MHYLSTQKKSSSLLLTQEQDSERAEALLDPLPYIVPLAGSQCTIVLVQWYAVLVGCLVLVILV